MANIDTPMWQRIFGTAWPTLIKENQGIGGFLLDHENRKAYADENAMKLIGARRDPQYDELTLILAQITERAEHNAELEMKICEYNEEITAGFFKFTEKHVFGSDNILPVCSQSQLVIAMSETKKHSMLALLQFEDRNNSSLYDFHVFSALSALKTELPSDALISSNTKNRFWLFIPNFASDEVEYLKNLQKAVETCILTDEMGEEDENRRITFSAGCAADIPVPSRRMHTAEFTLYEAVSGGCGSICKYSEERYEHQKNEYGNMRRFSQLIEKNLFVYHFQPIVSAHSGEIVAYEALMRTDNSIGMFPLEILGAATRYGRLYDIEKATMRNTIEMINQNQDHFKDKRLFVNSITAHMLNDADWAELENKYGELLEKVVVELTEQTEIGDDSLAVIHDRLKRNGMQLAIDDYGTGYSNMSNLLRYAPNVVKIDRSLIAGIDTKPKMQKFVTSIIEFVHSNGYSALAEGVETFEELKTMIQMGSDLIQGYYVSKPKPVLINAVSESVRQEIVDINAEYSSGIDRIYHTKNGEIINLDKLISDRYNIIFVESSSIVLEGSRGSRVNISMIIKDNLDTNITFRNVSVSTEKDDPILSLGSGSNVVLSLEGCSEIYGKGIYVPQTANLKFIGDGSLMVHSEALNGFGIGTDKNQSFGNIIFEGNGRIQVEVNGENVVGIGGGRNAGGSAVRVLGGALAVNCSGGTGIGIGCFDGGMIAAFSNCSADVHIAAANSIAVGSVTGSTDIFMSDFAFECDLSGLNLVGVGSVSEGSGRISFINGEIKEVMHGRNTNCLGTRGGHLDVSLSHCTTDLYCEGNSISGIGDMTGSGDIFITDSSNNIRFRTQDGMGIGSKDGSVINEKSINNIDINE